MTIGILIDMHDYKHITIIYLVESSFTLDLLHDQAITAQLDNKRTNEL